MPISKIMPASREGRPIKDSKAQILPASLHLKHGLTLVATHMTTTTAQRQYTNQANQRKTFKNGHLTSPGKTNNLCVKVSPAQAKQ
jgi:hypothetical protein